MSDPNRAPTERWEKIREIFDAAVELPKTDRPQLLASEFAGDPELLAEVESLLEIYDRDPDYLEREETESEPEPESVGVYRILERIGEGGMGAVYLAERDDGQFRHTVAVKLLRRGLDTEQILARFRAERQILATLDHPRIVRLLDGGISDNGRPYFVMEYIETGMPIDSYCEERALGLRDRLHLFRQVCDAVQYAHQRLIVHRDLKPANLLVSPDGQVKLLDFGIAKLLAPELADVTLLAPTRPEARLLTPEYASPEQIRGEPLTVASDVYALGVILYELLTGRRPYPARIDTPAELAEAICDRDPEKPSTAVSRGGGVSTENTTEAVADARDSQSAPANPQEGRARLLRGDLDNIVLKALRKEAGERYRSVESLDADVERHLERRPVLARPQTVSYRIRRFVQRNTGGVVATAAVAVSLIAGLAGTAWQARVANEQRDRARLEAQRSERVTDVMVDLFDLSDPVRNADADTLSVRDFAEMAARQITGDLAEQPALLGKMQTAIGRVNINLGQQPEAVELLESALEAQRELYSAPHLDTATTLHWLSRAREQLGDLGDAETFSREALAIRRELLGPAHPGVAEIENRLGHILAGQGRLEEAETHFNESLTIRRTALGPQHQQTAESLGSLAVLLYERGDYEGAEGYLRDAIRIKEEVLGSRHSRVAHEYNNLGAVLYAKQDYAGSLEAHRRTLSIEGEILGDEHPLVAFSYAHIGNIQHLLGDTEAAVINLERSLAIREGALGADHRVVAFSLKQLGSTLTTRGEYERAEELLLRAIEIDRRIHGDNHRLLAHGLNFLGRLYAVGGRLDEAVPILREALSIRRATHGPSHPNTAASAAALGRALLRAGEETEAEELIAAAVVTYESLFPDGHLFSAGALLAMGDLQLSRGGPEEAVAHYRRALELRQAKLPAGHWQIAEADSRVALVTAGRGDPLTVRNALEASCAALREQVGSLHPSTVLACAPPPGPTGLATGV
jgi:serine/threonine-protein kinase